MAFGTVKPLDPATHSPLKPIMHFVKFWQILGLFPLFPTDKMGIRFSYPKTQAAKSILLSLLPASTIITYFVTVVFSEEGSSTNHETIMQNWRDLFGLTTGDIYCLNGIKYFLFSFQVKGSLVLLHWRS